VVSYIDLADGTSAGEDVILNHLEWRRDAEDGDVGLGPVPPHQVRDGNRPTGLHADRHGFWHCGHHGVGIGFGNARTSLQAAPFFVVEEADPDWGSPHLKRVRADQRAGQVLLHVRVHARDDGHDGNQERHRDDDPEEGEERPQLVDADLLESSGYDVGEAHAPNFEYWRWRRYTNLSGASKLTTTAREPRPQD